MREFFRGWKRKAGCVTLALACVFMAGWIRSKNTMDVFTRIGRQSRETIQSLDGTLVFSRLTSSYVEPEHGQFLLFGDAYAWRVSPADFGFGFDENGVRLLRTFFTNGKNVRRWDLAGITIGCCEMGGGEMNEAVNHIRTCVFPYWSVVIPLMLLSAYLLHSKPRPEKPPESS